MNLQPMICVVDDDPSFREALSLLLQSAGHLSTGYASADAFLDEADLGQPGCVILDICMPGMSGMELQDVLVKRACLLSIIFITGHGDIPASVQSMKKGAVTFLTKPFDDGALLEVIDEALEKNRAWRGQREKVEAAHGRMAGLTPREYQVMACVITGALNKHIAAHLDITERTVKAHRGRVMEKTGVVSAVELVHLCETAGVQPASVDLA